MIQYSYVSKYLVVEIEQLWTRIVYFIIIIQSFAEKVKNNLLQIDCWKRQLQQQLYVKLDRIKTNFKTQKLKSPGPSCKFREYGENVFAT